MANTPPDDNRGLLEVYLQEVISLSRTFDKVISDLTWRAMEAEQVGNHQLAQDLRREIRVLRGSYQRLQRRVGSTASS